MPGLINLNNYLLDQAISFISDLTPELYKKACPAVFSSSMGQHLRHCIEHYDELILAKNENRSVNYDDRPRNASIETDPQVALARLTAIIVELDTFPEIGEKPMRVSDTGAEAPAPSSLNRELQYLVSHTVHHFALIAIIAKDFGSVVPANFGVAPSTLAYRNAQ